MIINFKQYVHNPSFNSYDNDLKLVENMDMIKLIENEFNNCSKNPLQKKTIIMGLIKKLSMKISEY